MELDEVLLKQQRFGLRAGYDGFDVVDTLHQRPRFGVVDGFGKVAIDAAFERFGFAHIDDVAIFAQHFVHAWQVGQALNQVIQSRFAVGSRCRNFNGCRVDTGRFVFGHCLFTISRFLYYIKLIQSLFNL